MAGNRDEPRNDCQLATGEPLPSLHEARIDEFIANGHVGTCELDIFIAAHVDEKKHVAAPLSAFIESIRQYAQQTVLPIRLLGIDADGNVVDGIHGQMSSDEIVFLSLYLSPEISAAQFDAFRDQLRRELATLTKQRENYKLAVAPEVRRALEFSLPEIRAVRSQLPASTQVSPLHPYAPGYDGTGVIVACIDFGCDFVHPNFRRADGSTRLIALWDHNEGGLGPVAGDPTPVGRPTAPFGFGREFGADALDAALTTDDPYFALGYDPHDNYYLDEVAGGAHGTHVLDVAAGNGSARVPSPVPPDRPMQQAPPPVVPKAPGVAPNADLLFVQVEQPKLSDGRSVLSAGRVLEALAWVFRTAGERGQPVVANISLSTNTGPHDGTALFDVAVGFLLAKRGRAVVVAAGNARNEALHARGTVAPDTSCSLTWQIHAKDRSANDVEIWYDAPVDLDVTLTPPGGDPLEPVEPGGHRTVLRAGRHVGDIFGSRKRAIGSAKFIRITLNPFENAGDWRITLTQTQTKPTQTKTKAKTGASSAAPVIVAFNAWINRDDTGQSRFAPNEACQAQTLGTFACSTEAIVVGAYNGLVPDRTAAFFSSEGPTRTGGEKPDVVAPGWDVFAARSKGFKPAQPGSPWRTAARVPMTGTSVAAPHVAGVVALMLQKKPTASSEEIRRILRETARPFSGGWHPRYGCGRVSATDAIAKV